MPDIVKILKSKHINYILSGATKEQIEQAEKALDLRFTNEYRDYLITFGVISFGGHEFTGFCASSRLNVVDVTISERINNPTVPMNYYVVEQANIDGIVVWQSHIGEVYQTAPNMQPFKLCNSLCEYIDL